MNKSRRHSDSTGAKKKGLAIEFQRVLSIRMGPSYLAIIDAAAADRNLTRSQLIKKAIWAYLKSGR